MATACVYLSHPHVKNLSQFVALETNGVINTSQNTADIQWDSHVIVNIVWADGAIPPADQMSVRKRSV